MTNKLKKLSRKSILKFNKTIKKVDHLKKSNLTEKDLYFKTHEIKFLFEDILNEFESENIKEEFIAYDDDQKKEFVWNHHLTQKKNSFTSMKFDFKSKHITKDLNDLCQTLTQNCICVIKNFEKSNGVKKLLRILDKCIKNKCKDSEIILITLKCLKSFGNNQFGIKKLYDDDHVCEILCKLISNDHNEEIVIALDLLSVICLYSENAGEKIISCFTKINTTRPVDRLKPLIICLMNISKIDVQRSVMYFINSLLHSTHKKREAGVTFRLKIRKELYNLGFERYLEAYRQSTDKILCHQADIFLSKSHIDREEFNFDFLTFQSHLTSLSHCTDEWNKIIYDEKYKESSIIKLMQLMIFSIKHDKNNLNDIIIYLKEKLQVFSNNTSQESLSDQINSENINEDNEHEDKILFLREKKLQKNKSFSSLSDLESINSELMNSSISTSDINKDSGMSTHFDRNQSSLFSISETESCSNSCILEEVNSFDNGLEEEYLESQLNCTIKSNLNSLSIKNSASQHLSENLKIIDFQKENISYGEKDSSNHSISLKSLQETLKPVHSNLITQDTNHSVLSAKSLLYPEPILKIPPFQNSLSSNDTSNAMSSHLPIPPPPPPPPPPPMLNNFIRSFPKSQSNTKECVKHINVTLISEKCLNEKSVWLNLKGKDLSNKAIIEKLFTRFSSKKAVELKTKIVKPLIIMDSKKAQNFEIFLRSVCMKIEELIIAIREMDVRSISLEMISKFISFVPEKLEILKLEPYKNKFEDLRLCEQFLVHLMEVDNYKIRLNGINLQILLTNDCLKEVENNLNLVDESFNKLLSSEKFRSVLGMILLLIQAMNPEKTVVGVSIDSLTKLIDTKDNCNGNLLEFIVEQLQEISPDSLNVWDDFESLDSVSRISSESMDSILAHFSSSLKSLQNDIENIDCSILKREICATVELAKNLLSHTKFLQNSLELKYRQICDFLTITKPTYTFENLFSDLKIFKNQFNQAIKVISDRQRLNEIHKQKMESINKLQIQQVQRSDQLVSFLSSLEEQSFSQKPKSVFKQSAFIENAIIGISSGKVFCDDEAVLNWNVQYHRRENQKNRLKNARSYRRMNLNNLTPSRIRKLDVTQLLTTEQI